MSDPRIEGMKKNPSIVAWGKTHIKAYAIQEYIDSFRRAFVDRGADFITLDSNMRGQKFLAASVAWALEEGWMHCSDVGGYPLDLDAQETVWAFRLTDKGRAELGLPKAA